MILGAVLAGGKAQRFGSDKALAELGGHTLLARAVDALAGHCEHVVVVGRELAPAPTLPDWPGPDMGPLAGLAAALHLARDENYEAVLTCGVDSVGLPDDILSLLRPGPSIFESQPVVGLWPATCSATVDALLENDDKHAMYRLAELANARSVKPPQKPANINTPADLEALEKRDGL